MKAMKSFAGNGTARERRVFLRTVATLTAVLFCGGVTNAALADGSLERVKKEGLTVCGVDGLLPYSSSDEKVPGFEVEIAKAIAEELGTSTKYTWVSWDGLIPALTSKRCDAIING